MSKKKNAPTRMPVGYTSAPLEELNAGKLFRVRDKDFANVFAENLPYEAAHKLKEKIAGRGESQSVRVEDMTMPDPRPGAGSTAVFASPTPRSDLELARIQAAGKRVAADAAAAANQRASEVQARRDELDVPDDLDALENDANAVASALRKIADGADPSSVQVELDMRTDHAVAEEDFLGEVRAALEAEAVQMRSAARLVQAERAAGKTTVELRAELEAAVEDKTIDVDALLEELLTMPIGNDQPAATP